MTREEAIKELKEDIELYIPLHGTIDDVDRDLPDGRLITALEMGIKALEQEPCEEELDFVQEHKKISCNLIVEPCEDADMKLIHTQGLDEGIRCAMCTNSMATDKGCDGGCVVNEVMYKKILDVIRRHIIDGNEL